MLRLTLSLLLVGAMASGCANTVGDPEDIISGDLAGDGWPDLVVFGAQRLQVFFPR